MFRIIQITDTHLMASPDATPDNINVYQHLCKAIEHIKQEQLNPDFLLLSGDLSNDGTVESYQLLKGCFKDFNCPIYRLNGNHDHKQNLEDTLQGDGFLNTKSFSHEQWHFILLDSCIPKKISGRIADTEFAFLQQEIEAYPDKSIVIALHHDPSNVTGFMKEYSLLNNKELRDFLVRYPNVRFTLCGHVHQEATSNQGPLIMYSCPSTFFQVHPFSEKLIMEEDGIGYRVIDFYEQDYQTRVVRVT